MITFLGSLDSASIPEGAVLRAGGTDLQERLRTHNLQPDIVDLTGVAGFADITRDDDRVTVGAGTPIAVVARDLRADYPALAMTAGSLATPQIRAVGTIGGNLLQRTRCWYFRHPEIRCLKSGGDTCPAHTGRHLYGVAFDNSACVHPHPSSLAMALLTYDASVTLASGGELTVAALLGDGLDPTRDHQLPDGEIVASIRLPAPWPREKAAYFRAISRFEAEWPLVEAVARVRVDADGVVTDCGLGLGGVATVPLRPRAAEDLLRGARLDEATIDRVSQACAEGANPLPETGYKVDLIVATVREVLESVAREGV
jgi:xanthine dehydrogenase YagS FAD-binding subunit